MIGVIATLLRKLNPQFSLPPLVRFYCQESISFLYVTEKCLDLNFSCVTTIINHFIPHPHRPILKTSPTVTLSARLIYSTRARHVYGTLNYFFVRDFYSLSHQQSIVNLSDITLVLSLWNHSSELLGISNLSDYTPERYLCGNS